MKVTMPYLATELLLPPLRRLQVERPYVVQDLAAIALEARVPTTNNVHYVAHTDGLRGDARLQYSVTKRNRSL
jgi:hypothetical protein